jgi:hypothetical protein
MFRLSYNNTDIIGDWLLGIAIKAKEGYFDRLANKKKHTNQVLSLIIVYPFVVIDR